MSLFPLGNAKMVSHPAQFCILSFKWISETFASVLRLRDLISFWGGGWGEVREVLKQTKSSHGSIEIALAITRMKNVMGASIKQRFQNEPAQWHSLLFTLEMDQMVQLLSFQGRKREPHPHPIFQHLPLSLNTAEASVCYMRLLMNWSTVLGCQ